MCCILLVMVSCTNARTCDVRIVSINVSVLCQDNKVGVKTSNLCNHDNSGVTRTYFVCYHLTR